MSTNRKRWPWSVAALAACSLALASGAARPPQTQDWLTLERRLSAIEQRIYSMETRLSQVERQALRGPQAAAPQAADQNVEVNLLRSELDILAARLRLIECGVTRLDERTLAPNAREARRKAGAAAADSCRRNADEPLQFPPR
jgi:type IV pilus biogenesis protein CpaD/CtpE